MYITYIIIGLTVLISFYAWKDSSIMGRLILNPYTVQRKNEFHRFVTSGFIHQDHMHLLLNMFSLYFFGLAVERVFRSVFGPAGNIYFVILYLAAIIVSDLPTF